MSNMKKLSLFVGILLLMILATGCSEKTAGSEGSGSMTNSEITENTESTENTENKQETSIPSAESENMKASDNTNESTEAPELFYFGHASICIVTADNKVIYIDPYANGDYSRFADLILVTHDHFDHNQTDKVENRNADCEIITQTEALVNGEYKTFEFPFVTVEAVEAGNNQNHDINECVGYVLTFNNGKSVYISGDTSTTDQMNKLSEKHIDYAFYCCDGVYNMNIDEASQCAATVGAKHNIPYHNSTSHTGEMFDRELADKFNAPNKMIVYPGDSIMIQ